MNVLVAPCAVLNPVEVVSDVPFQHSLHSTAKIRNVGNVDNPIQYIRHKVAILRGGNQIETSRQQHELATKIPEKQGQVVVAEKPNAVSVFQTHHRQWGQVQRTTQSWMRRQFWALLALRVGFALLAPISLVALAVLFVAGTVVHATFLLTLTFCASQTRMIMTSLTKAALAVLLASLCGVLLPCGLELTEPILRIRYQRQLRKIHHLHTLLTDPVLVETLQQLLRGAGTVTAMTQRQLAASARASQKKFAEMTESGYIAASSLLSTEMVEQLITEVSANSQFLQDLKTKTPPAVWRWTRQQYTALKESGLLESAARQAIQALQGELESASEFLPYLDAIEKVRREQQDRLAKKLLDAKKAERKRSRKLFSSI
eukprot:scaffold4510_cov183-Amphora_coffeaeformis.AAC.4